MYMALEPHVRRRWPKMLVGWTRLFAGKWGDPLVGRHVLFGVAGAMAVSLLGVLSGLAEKSLRLDPVVGDLQALTGVRFQISAMVSMFANTIGSATLLLFLLLGLRELLRNQWVAMVVTASIFAAMGALNSGLPWFTFAIAFIINGLLILYLFRFGFLAMVVAVGGSTVLQHFPPAMHWMSWYAPSWTMGIFSLAALTLYGYIVSTAGQKTPEEDLL